ncbi:MAG: hypothetical protein R2991_10825 [Thermoanaerobaculia bacterium]
MQCIRSDSTLFVLALALLFGSGLAAAQDTDGDAGPDSIENQSWYLDAGGSSRASGRLGRVATTCRER